MRIFDNIGDPVIIEENETTTTWKWTIPDIRNYLNIGRESLMSHEFTFEKVDRRTTHWKLKLHPNGVPDVEDQDMKIGLVNVDQTGEYKIAFRFGILDAQNVKVIQLHQLRSTFNQIRKNTPSLLLLKRDIVMDNDNPYIIDGSLNVWCKLREIRV